MRRVWLLFTQAVTVGVVVFVLAALVTPDSLPWRNRTVVIGQAATTAVPARQEGGGTTLSFHGAAAAAIPSVVAVYVEKGGGRRPPGPFADPDEGGQGGGLGSGVVMSEDGFILTNNHVVAGAATIAVGLSAGQTVPAKVIGTDPETDLAVVKVEVRGLRPIALGNSDAAQVGDIVLAIGNPFGVGQTVTQGIVSATGRNRVGINTFENFIQTDAAINPGNSGGAPGRLLGINSAILSPSGGSLGIGFAIPVTLATQVMQQLVKDGRVARGWVGVEARDLTPDLARQLRVPGERGSVVMRLLRGGPAERAGLAAGDVVVAINGKDVPDTVGFVAGTAAIRPGTKGQFTVMRQGAKVNLDIEVGRRPPLTRAE